MVEKISLDALKEALQHQQEELSAIYQISKEIKINLSLDKILDSILDNATKALNSEIASIMLLDEEGLLMIKNAKGLPQEIIETVRIGTGESISGYVFATGVPLLCKDIESDPRFARKNSERYYTHSFISAPLKIKQKVIGVINVNNKISKAPYTEEDLRLLEILASMSATIIENFRLYENLQDVYLRTVSVIIDIMEAKDPTTAHHTRSVTKYAVQIAKELSLSPEEIKIVKQATQLHDIGKIGIPDTILNKPGRLTPEEWETVKTHPLLGAVFVQALPLLKEEILDIVRHHHERYDGKGYPDGLKEKDISLGARIVSVADAYEAMIADRPYRKALPQEKVIAELKKGSGSQFDSLIVETLLRILERGNLEKIK